MDVHSRYQCSVRVDAPGARSRDCVMGRGTCDIEAVSDGGDRGRVALRTCGHAAGRAPGRSCDGPCADAEDGLCERRPAVRQRCGAPIPGSPPHGAGVAVPLRRPIARSRRLLGRATWRWRPATFGTSRTWGSKSSTPGTEHEPNARDEEGECGLIDTKLAKLRKQRQ